MTLYAQSVCASRLKLFGTIWRRGTSGWGEWPSSIEDSLFIGFLLGFWVEQGAEELIIELSGDRLSIVEDHCRRNGFSLEQFLIERIVEGIEGRKD
jgi:hypothetical protein